MVVLVKDLKAFLQPAKIKIDSFVFFLHYKVTPVLLMSFCTMMTVDYYWKGHINCIFDEYINKYKEAANAFCYIKGAHTLSQKGNLLVEAHPGVRKMDEADQVKYHLYYQWLFLFFFVSGASFCIPRILWKNYEGGRLNKLCTHLKDFMMSDEDRIKKVNATVAYIKKGRGFNNAYVYMYLFCEFLNLANVVVQALFADVFLQYEFSTLGLHLLNLLERDPNNRIDPLATIFPKVTKCTFNLFGPGGSIVPYDGVCVLNLNNLNEKLFLVWWFWLLILSCVTVVHVLYRLICIVCPCCRFVLLRRSCVLVEPKKIRLICRKFKVGDWFMLFLLGKNIDFVTFKDVLEAIWVTLKPPVRTRNVPLNNIDPPNAGNLYADGRGDAAQSEIYMESEVYSSYPSRRNASWNSDI